MHMDDRPTVVSHYSKSTLKKRRQRLIIRSEATITTKNESDSVTCYKLLTLLDSLS